MTGSEIGLTVVASILGLIATILTILTFFKNQTKDKSAETKEFTAVQTDIGYIKDGISELKSMVQAQTDKQHGLELKVQKIEDKVNDVDSRLVNLEKKRAVSKKGVN